MDEIIWSNKLASGNETIDNEHKELISTVNRLVTTAHLTVHSETLSAVYGDLVQYINKHFQTEEALLESYGYPGLEEHKKQHYEFAEKLTNLIRK